jgi:hypothetical protein
MTRPVTVPNAFAAQTGSIPLSQLDANNAALVAAINDPATYKNYAVDTGAANAYTITLNPAPSSQASLIGVPIVFKAVNANTTASTLNVNGLGVVAIKNNDGTAILGGAIPANSIVQVVYDGTNYQLFYLTSAASKTVIGGYTRIGPNMCMKLTPSASGTSLTRDAVTNVASPGAGVVALMVDIFTRANSGNSIALRNTTVNCYSDAGATVYLASVACSAREEVAVAAGTTLMELQQRLVLPVASPYLQMVDDAGNQGFATYQVIGYFD